MSDRGNTEGTPQPIDEVEETTEKIDVTFQKLQTSVDGLLSAITDAVNSIKPDLDAKITEVMTSVSKQLATAGLGAFGMRAAKIAKDELQSSFSVESLFSLVLEAIETTRATVLDVLEETRKDATRDVGQSTGGLQAKLLQMHAQLSELEKQLESTRGEVRTWRGRSNEIEVRLRQREDVMATSSEEMLRMHSSIKELNEQIQERDSTISSLKGELSQAQSQAEQQSELMRALDSAEEQLTSNYDEKIIEISQVQGQLSQQAEHLDQKEAEIATLRSEIEKLQQEKFSVESQVSTMADELASLKGSERNVEAEIVDMLNEVEELKARWDTLYRVAEDDPTFKAYFLIADKTQWFQLPHLSSALGIPTVLLKRNLQKFVDVGLLEIEDDKVRPRSLSDIVKEVKETDEQMLETARAEADGSKAESIETMDLLPDYLGPEDGEDYEQEGR